MSDSRIVWTQKQWWQIRGESHTNNTPTTLAHPAVMQMIVPRDEVIPIDYDRKKDDKNEYEENVEEGGIMVVEAG